jgi:hypothetical protein
VVLIVWPRESMHITTAIRIATPFRIIEPTFEYCMYVLGVGWITRGKAQILHTFFTCVCSALDRSPSEQGGLQVDEDPAAAGDRGESDDYGVVEAGRTLLILRALARRRTGVCPVCSRARLLWPSRARATTDVGAAGVLLPRPDEQAGVVWALSKLSEPQTTEERAARERRGIHNPEGVLPASEHQAAGGLCHAGAVLQ